LFDCHVHKIVGRQKGGERTDPIFPYAPVPKTNAISVGAHDKLFGRSVHMSCDGVAAPGFFIREIDRISVPGKAFFSKLK